MWCCGLCRYFLRKLRKVKKANGQILACNEVRDWWMGRACVSGCQCAAVRTLSVCCAVYFCYGNSLAAPKAVLPNILDTAAVHHSRILSGQQHTCSSSHCVDHGASTVGDMCFRQRCSTAGWTGQHASRVYRWRAAAAASAAALTGAAAASCSRRSATEGNHGSIVWHDAVSQP